MYVYTGSVYVDVCIKEMPTKAETGKSDPRKEAIL